MQYQKITKKQKEEKQSMKTKEQIIDLIRDAISHAQINQQIWIEQGNNKEFRPSIEVFENGFIVSMWHSASSPQHVWRRKVLTTGETKLGEYLIGHIFDASIEDDEVNDTYAQNLYNVYNDCVERDEQC